MPFCSSKERLWRRYVNSRVASRVQHDDFLRACARARESRAVAEIAFVAVGACTMSTMCVTRIQHVLRIAADSSMLRANLERPQRAHCATYTCI